MMRATGLFAAVLLVGAVAAWWAHHARDGASLPAAPDAKAAPAAASAKDAASRAPVAVLALDPRTAASPVVRAGMPAGAMHEFLTAKRYGPLWDRLRNSAEGSTAEGALVLHRIARRCAHVTDRPAPTGAPNRTSERLRDDFMKTLAPNDPRRDKRLAAFEAVTSARCEGIDVSLTQAELRSMLAKAVDAGSAEARAVQIGDPVSQEQRARMDQATLTDAQIQILQQLAASKDPGAVLEVGRILSNSYHDLTARDGGDGAALEPLALHNAWTLVACEYGYPCGADNTMLQRECAYRGYCDASSVQDHLYYYAASPHDSQLMSHYQAILRTAIETGDWSGFTLARGTVPPNTPRYFWGSSD